MNTFKKLTLAVTLFSGLSSFAGPKTVVAKFCDQGSRSYMAYTLDLVNQKGSVENRSSDGRLIRTTELTTLSSIQTYEDKKQFDYSVPVTSFLRNANVLLGSQNTPSSLTVRDVVRYHNVNFRNGATLSIIEINRGGKRGVFTGAITTQNRQLQTYLPQNCYEAVQQSLIFR